MDQLSQETFANRTRSIIHLISDGHGSVKKASEIFSISQQAIRKTCARAGVDMATAKANLSKNVAEAIAQGTAKTDVYAKFGVKVAFVKEACGTHGVPFTAQGCNHEQVLEILSDLINSDASLSVISRKHSVSPYLVSRIYLKAISSGIPIQERKSGKQSQSKIVRFCIPLDDAIDCNPRLFSAMTQVLSGRAEIHIIASSSVGSKENIQKELESKNLKYDYLTLSDDRVKYVIENQIDVLFETEDSHLQNVPSGVLVLKVRDGENFCFESKRWLYSDSTGELI